MKYLKFHMFTTLLLLFLTACGGCTTPNDLREKQLFPAMELAWPPVHDAAEAEINKALIVEGAELLTKTSMAMNAKTFEAISKAPFGRVESIALQWIARREEDEQLPKALVDKLVRRVALFTEARQLYIKGGQ